MKVFFSSLILFLGTSVSSAALAKNGPPRIFLENGAFRRGQAEVLVQPSAFPGYQYIQVSAYNDAGERQSFDMYHNGYNGEFYVIAESESTDRSKPKLLGLSRPGDDEQFVTTVVTRNARYVSLALIHGEFSSEKRYAVLTIDLLTSTISAISFETHRAAKKFLGIPYRYRITDEATISMCEEELSS